MVAVHCSCNPSPRDTPCARMTRTP
jgi:hypothetical protein